MCSEDPGIQRRLEDLSSAAHQRSPRPPHSPLVPGFAGLVAITTSGRDPLKGEGLIRVPPRTLWSRPRRADELRQSGLCARDLAGMPRDEQKVRRRPRDDLSVQVRDHGGGFEPVGDKPLVAERP